MVRYDHCETLRLCIDSSPQCPGKSNGHYAVVVLCISTVPVRYVMVAYVLPERFWEAAFGWFLAGMGDSWSLGGPGLWGWRRSRVGDSA